MLHHHPNEFKTRAAPITLNVLEKISSNWTQVQIKHTTFVPIIQEQIRRTGTYKDHSFRRGAAQQASNNGLPDTDTQALGRWTSQAFKASL
jgi:hypothetical protein